MFRRRPQFRASDRRRLRMALEILAVKALENPLCLVLVQGDLQSTLKGDWMALEGINHRPRAVAILFEVYIHSLSSFSPAFLRRFARDAQGSAALIRMKPLPPASRHPCAYGYFAVEIFACCRIKSVNED